MLWRFRCVLTAFVELPENVGILCWRATASKIETKPGGENIYLLDFFVEAQGSEAAYYSGLAKAYAVADALSHRSLSPALLQPLSATIPAAAINESFPITIPNPGEAQNCAQVSIDDCANTVLGGTAQTEDLQRRLREAMSAQDALHAFSILWSALEPVLELMAREQEQWSPQRECPKCQNPIAGRMPSTQRSLQSLLNTIKLDSTETKFNAKCLRTIRGKIIHGTGIGDPDFRREVENTLPVMFAVAAAVICARENTKTWFGIRAFSNHALATFHMRFSSRDRVGIDWDLPASAGNRLGIVKMPENMHCGQDNSYRFGLWEQPHYNGLHLPDLKG